MSPDPAPTSRTENDSAGSTRSPIIRSRALCPPNQRLIRAMSRKFRSAGTAPAYSKSSVPKTRLPQSCSLPGFECARILLSGILLQISDDLAALVGFFDVKGHVVIRGDFLRVGEPPVQRIFLPNNPGLLEGLGILERIDGSRGAPVHASETWPFFVAIERVASAAALFK